MDPIDFGDQRSKVKVTIDVYGNKQGCNFVKFSRGLVGSLNKNSRSPQEYQRAHNEIQYMVNSLFLVEKNAETVNSGS